MSRKAELLITLTGDAFVLTVAFFVSWKASALEYPMISLHAIIAGCLLLLYWLFLFQSANLYRTRSKILLMNEIWKMLQMIVIGLIIFLATAALMEIDFIRARGFIPSYAIALSALIVWRFFWRGMVGEYIRPRRQKVVIFHNGDITKNPGEFDVVQRISLNRSSGVARELVKNNDIDGILIDSNGLHTDQVLKVIASFAETNYEIYVSPKLYPVIHNYALFEKIDASPFLKIVFHPLSRWDRFLKRIIDIFISVVSLLILSPILAFLAAAIKLDTPGPVFHKQDRTGLRGSRFTLIKYRSMVSDAEKHTGPVWAKKNDTRITRTGRIMRPLRLDELPQLINVLRGEMSFVGPRPERPAFVEQFRKEIPFYGLRLTVLPGITGWAQVKHTYDSSVDDVKRKLQFDLEYIHNMSLQLDLKVFLKTILTVMKKEGAH